MFVSLLASALIFTAPQDASATPAPTPATAERYEQAMRCAGVMEIEVVVTSRL